MQQVQQTRPGTLQKPALSCSGRGRPRSNLTRIIVIRAAGEGLRPPSVRRASLAASLEMHGP